MTREESIADFMVYYNAWATARSKLTIAEKMKAVVEKHCFTGFIGHYASQPPAEVVVNARQACANLAADVARAGEALIAAIETHKDLRLEDDKDVLGGEYEPSGYH